MTMNQSFAEQVTTPDAISDPAEVAKVARFYEELLLQTDTTRVAFRLARTYAEALLGVAEGKGEAEAVGEQFRSLFQDVFPATPGFEGLLVSPGVSRKRKDEFLAKALEGKASPLFVDFLRVLNRKDRLGLLRPVAVAYRTLRENSANRTRVLVETAAPLTPAQTQSLTETLAATIGKTPVLVVRENPDLIGGLVVHVGDKVFDTSVRTKLQTLRTKLLARGNHEIQRGRDRFSH